MPSYLFFYCHKCIAKTRKSLIVSCQPFNNTCSSDSSPSSDQEDVESEDYLNITVQLFPNTICTSSDKLKLLTITNNDNEEYLKPMNTLLREHDNMITEETRAVSITNQKEIPILD